MKKSAKNFNSEKYKQINLNSIIAMKVSTMFFLTLLILLSQNGLTVGQQLVTVNNPEWGKWQEKKDAPIKFELLQTYGEELSDRSENETVNFYSSNSIWGINTDEENNVYVLDVDANMIVKFTPNGKLLWKIDQKGRGPGDLENVLSFTVGDNIYVTNLMGTRLDVFSLDGRFEKSINLSSINNKSQHIVGIVSGRYLILKSEILGKAGANIIALDIKESFKLISEFNALDNPNLKIPKNERILSPTSIVGDLIAVSRDFSYGIKYYDIYGNLVKEIRRDLPRYLRPGIYNPDPGERGIMISLGAVFSHFELKKGFLLNFVIWPENLSDPDEVAQKISQGSFPNLKQKSSLDLYSNSGELLYSIESEGTRPEIGWLKHSDNEGNIYTKIDKPFPQVRKYKVVITE